MIDISLLTFALISLNALNKRQHTGGREKRTYLLHEVNSCDR